VGHARQIERNERSDADTRQDQRNQRQLRRVERRNDDDRAEVIDDGQGQQKYF